jgi:ParB family transcriptional regulator, chromosome partitioning protein
MPKVFSTSPVILGIMDDIEISQIQRSDLCHRSLSLKLDDLCSSIKEKGLLQPIIVRPKDEQFQIIAGNRRYEVCKNLGWRKIVCHVIELNDKEAFEVSIAENVQRKNLTPLEEAKTFQSYASKFGWGGISSMAKKIGKSVHYVERRVRLLDLPQDVLSSIESAEIKPSVVEELLCLKDKQQQSEFARLAKDRKLSSRKMRNLVNEFQGNPIYDPRNIELSYTVINDLDNRTQRAFDKSITVMRVAMHKLTDIMENMEDNWIVYETLRNHRNILHERIDLLIKQKRKI